MQAFSQFKIKTSLRKGTKTTHNNEITSNVYQPYKRNWHIVTHVLPGMDRRQHGVERVRVRGHPWHQDAPTQAVEARRAHVQQVLATTNQGSVERDVTPFTGTSR